VLTLGLTQVAEILEQLQSKAIQVHPERCVRVRHRKAECTACANVCTSGTIIGEEGLRIDPDRCAGCGVCTTACPTGALEASAPSNVELVARIQRIAAQQQWVAFSCQRHLEAGGQDRSPYIETVCLGRVDESILLSAASFGIRDIFLVSAACEDCPRARGREVALDTVEKTSKLLEKLDLPARIHWTGALPAELAAPRPSAVSPDAVSRRGFFSLLARETRRVTAVAADTVLRSSEQPKESPLPMGEPPAALPPIKRRVLLEALSRSLGDRPVPDTLLDGTGTWAEYHITENCAGCQMCAYFCPTGALSKWEDHGQVGVRFRVSQCTACGLCHDACFKQSATLTEHVRLREVSENEEIIITMRQADEAPWMLPAHERLAVSLFDVFAPHSSTAARRVTPPPDRG